MSYLTTSHFFNFLQFINLIKLKLFQETSAKTVEMLVKKSKDFSEEVTPQEIEVVVDLVQQSGPSVSAVEMQRMAKQSNVDLSVEDIETVIQIQEEMGGKKLTEAEVQVSKIVLFHFCSLLICPALLFFMHLKLFKSF